MADALAKTVDEMSRRLDNLEASIQASAKSQNEESK
jgi:heat shock factor-binding protein 1